MCDRVTGTNTYYVLVALSIVLTDDRVLLLLY